MAKVPAIQLPPEEVSSVPSQASVLDNDDKIKLLGHQVQRRKLDYEHSQQRLVDYLLAKVATLSAELIALKEESAATSARLSLETIREEPLESARSVNTEFHSSFLAALRHKLVTLQELLRQALLRQQILMRELQRYSRAQSVAESTTPPAPPPPHTPNIRADELEYGPALLSTASQEEARVVKTDQGVQAGPELNESRDNNSRERVVYSRSPAQYWRTKRDSRTLSHEKPDLMRGSTTLGVPEVGTPPNMELMRAARRAYRLSSGHQDEQASFLSEGVANNRPTVYDAKYWVSKVSRFMEEKKVLLRENKASHAQIMKMMDENSQLKRLVKERDSTLSRLRAEAKGEMQRTYLEPSYDPLRMLKAHQKRKRSERAERARARSEYLKQKSMKSTTTEAEPQQKEKEQQQQYTIPPRPLELFSQHSEPDVTRLGKQMFQQGWVTPRGAAQK